MTTLDTKRPKARKEHVCYFCGGTIKKGEVYESQTNVDAGDIYTCTTHLRCNELTHKLDMWREISPSEGLSDDWFQEDVRECYYGLTGTKYRDETPKFQVMLNHVLKHFDLL